MTSTDLCRRRPSLPHLPPLYVMPKPRHGGATAAARVLNKSTSQLNDIRDRAMLEYDPATKLTRPIATSREMEAIYQAEVGLPSDGDQRFDPVRMHYLRSRYLVCPALYAYKLPGAQWQYDLAALEELGRNGPPMKSESAARSTATSPRG